MESAKASLRDAAEAVEPKTATEAIQVIYSMIVLLPAGHFYPVMYIVMPSGTIQESDAHGTDGFCRLREASLLTLRISSRSRSLHRRPPLLTMRVSKARYSIPSALLC